MSFSLRKKVYKIRGGVQLPSNPAIFPSRLVAIESLNWRGSGETFMVSGLVYDSGCGYMIVVMMEADSGFDPQTLLLPCYCTY